MVPFSKYRQCIIIAPVVLTACLRVRYARCYGAGGKRWKATVELGGLT